MTTSRAFRCGAKRRVDSREICQPLPDDRERRKGRLLAFVECIVRIGAEALQPVGVRQHLACRRELVVLARRRRDLLDLRQLEGQELGARGVLAHVGEQPFALGVDVSPCRERLGDGRPFWSEPGKRVEDVDVGGRVQQDLVLVLSVKIDQDAGEIAERARWLPGRRRRRRGCGPAPRSPAAG